MIIDQKLLDTLSSQAKANPRLRQAYDLRNTPADAERSGAGDGAADSQA